MALKGNDPRNTRAYRKIRQKILLRDNHTCYICGGDGNEVDHVIPIVRGGDPIDPENLRCICRACNLRKGYKTGVFLAPTATPLDFPARLSLSQSKPVEDSPMKLRKNPN